MTSSSRDLPGLLGEWQLGQSGFQGVCVCGGGGQAPVSLPQATAISNSCSWITGQREEASQGQEAEGGLDSIVGHRRSKKHRLDRYR